MDNLREEPMDNLNETPELANVNNDNPFCVPEDYFEGLGGRIKNQIFLEKLKQKETGEGFSMPIGYFDDMKQAIQARIVEEKLKESVTETGYTVPDGYFQQLTADINQRLTVKTSKKSTVIKLLHNRIVKYASAACLLIIGGYATIQIQENRQVKRAEVSKAQFLYDIDESTIVDHINNTNTTVPIQKQDALENYILDHYTEGELTQAL